MAKYTLSDKQKSAFKAVLNALGVKHGKYEKRKIGKNSYTSFEVSLFAAKGLYESAANKMFENKSSAFSKRWRRSWNSIPSLSEIRDMAKKEYQKEIDALQKKRTAKMKNVEAEKDRLNEVAMKRFYQNLEKAKKATKQTKNVKELLAVEDIVIKKSIDFLKEIYNYNSFSKDSWYKKFFDNEYIEKTKLEIHKAFLDKKSSINKHLDNIQQKDIPGYRKQVLDMRGPKKQAYHRAFNWCRNDKDLKKYEEEAKKEKIENNKWYREYIALQKSIKNKFNDAFVQGSNINTYVVGQDIYEPQREDEICTLNMSIDKFGNISYGYDSGFDEWSYIPKEYSLTTNTTLKIRFGFATSKTKSFMTDTRKLKTLEKEVEKIDKEISKKRTLQDSIYFYCYNDT